MGFKKNGSTEATIADMQKRIDELEARVDALTARAPEDEEDNEEERFRKGYEAILGYDYQKALDFGGDMR